MKQCYNFKMFPKCPYLIDLRGDVNLNRNEMANVCAAHPCQYGQEKVLQTVIVQEASSIINALSAMTRCISLSIENHAKILSPDYTTKTKKGE